MHVVILSGSTRIHRQSHRVALALERWLRHHTPNSAEIVDLAAYRLPVLEEVLARHPQPPEGLSDFAQRIRRGDAFVFVSPEYNGSYTAALKNAVDYLREREFAQKVIGVAAVSTGSLGGIRAALAMQQLVLGIHAYPVPQMLTVGQVQQRFDEQGQLIDASFEKPLQQFMEGFLWLSEAVAEKRISEMPAATV